jgi:hypothetical protein
MLGIIDDMWWNWVSDFGLAGEFMTPPPEITKDGVKPHPSDGARKPMPGSGCSIQSPGSRRPCKAPAVAARLAPLGILQTYATPEQTRAEIREEFKRVSEMARKTGLLK